MIMGVIALLLGWFWGLWFPINKTLWTSSYVMVSGGIALLVFSVCYGCIEIKHLSKYTQPFEWFGTHAILVYVLHVGCLKIQALIQVPGHDGSSHNLRWVITEKLFGWASPMNASLGYAVLYMHLWLLCIYVVHCVEQKKEVPLHAHALDT